jgi:hypothetical protein
MLKICNKCGDEIKTVYDDLYGLESKVSGGYCSDHLLDMTKYEWAMCELCLRTMFNGFKVPPTTFCLSTLKYESYSKDLEYYNYMLWERNGGKENARQDGRCTFDNLCTDKGDYHLFQDGELSHEVVCEKHIGDHISILYEYTKYISLNEKEQSPANKAFLAMHFMDELLKNISKDNPIYIRFMPIVLMNFLQLEIGSDKPYPGMLVFYNTCQLEKEAKLAGCKAIALDLSFNPIMYYGEYTLIQELVKPKSIITSIEKNAW